MIRMSEPRISLRIGPLQVVRRDNACDFSSKGNRQVLYAGDERYISAAVKGFLGKRVSHFA